MSLREIYSIKLEPFFNQTYMNIVTISDYPKGPLKEIVKKVKSEKLSTKEPNGGKCIFSLLSLKDDNKYMDINEIPKLYAYLKNNHYDITDIKLNWEQNVICFIEYYH